MRNPRLILFVAILTIQNCLTQNTACFFDDINGFYGYSNGIINKLEFNKIDTFFLGKNFISYIDYHGNFKLYKDNKVYTISPLSPLNIKTSSYLMAYSFDNVQLGVFNQTHSKTIEHFIKYDYLLSDSMLAYIDNFNTLKLYYKDSIYEILFQFNNEKFDISDNMLTFVENNKFKLFYRNEIIEIEPFEPKNFKMAKDILAYNDFQNYFKVFINNNLETIEDYYIDKYWAGDKFVVYINQNMELVLYNGRIKKILSYNVPKEIEVVKNILFWTDLSDNSYLYCHSDTSKVQKIENYKPLEYNIFENMFVYKDIYGYLKGFIDGEKISISTNIVKWWQLQHNCVVYYDLTNAINTVWDNKNIVKYNKFSDNLSK